jgi:hypothetical protein
VLLFSPDGTLAAAAGDAPSEGIFAEVTRRPATIVELEHEGWHALATPVSGGAGAPGWLAVSSRRTLPSPRLARQAARATAPVLAALGRVDALARRQQQAIGAALLEELLKPSRGRDRAALAARAAALGIDFAMPARIVLIRGGTAERLTDRAQLVAARRD